MSEPAPETLAGVVAAYRESSGSPGRRMDLVRQTMDMVLDLDRTELEAFLAGVIRDDPDSIVRHEAVFLSGVLVNWGQIGGAVVGPEIVRCAREEMDSTVVRHESVEALSNFRSLESVAVCERALEDEVADVSRTAVISLERLSYHESSPREVAAAARAALDRARERGLAPAR